MTGANAVQSFVGQLIRDSRVAEFAWDGNGRPWRVRRNGRWATINDVQPPAFTLEDQPDAPVVPQVR
jgi:hypothetical protein